MTTFTERHAIEIAFRNLEQQKEERRRELREDLKEIDQRQYFIMDRLQAIDARNVDAVTAGSAIDHLNQVHDEIRDTFAAVLQKKQPEPIQADPIREGIISGAITEATIAVKQQMVDAANKMEPVTTFEPIREKTADMKIKPQPKPPKRRGIQAEQISLERGAELLVDILEAATEPLTANDIAKAIQERTGRTYANPYGAIKKWMDAAGGRVKKIGTKYSLIEKI